MTDLRARLAKALSNDKRAFWGFPPLRRKAMSLQVADVLLSLPGIAIVELPQPDHDLDFYVEGVCEIQTARMGAPGLDIAGFHRRVTSDEARSLAAGLLAAASRGKRRERGDGGVREERHKDEDETLLCGWERRRGSPAEDKATWAVFR